MVICVLQSGSCITGKHHFAAALSRLMADWMEGNGYDDSRVIGFIPSVRVSSDVRSIRYMLHT